MKSNELKNYKRIYLEEKISKQAIEKSWDTVRRRLPQQDEPKKYYYPAAFMFASMLLFFFLGTIGVSQASRPGDVLYPVKVLSDKVAAKVTGNYHTKVEKRATEVIREADRSPERLEEATKAYKDSLEQAKREAQRDSKDKPEIRKTLEKQEERLKNIHASSSASQKLIRETVSQTQRVREEVKGVQSGEPDRRKPDVELPVPDQRKKDR